MVRTRAQLAARMRRVSVSENKGGTKRPFDDSDEESVQKRPRRSFGNSHLEKNFDESNIQTSCANEPINLVDVWRKTGSWPKEYFNPVMEHLLARKKSLSSLSRKRSNSAASSTPSDQRPREEKSAPYRDQRYETLLETKYSFLTKSGLDITATSKYMVKNLLDAKQIVPKDTLFGDSTFENTCQKIHNRNEARVIQDISRLIVPSAETLATFGAKHLEILMESVNEGWNNSIPLTGTRPQPDYSVGFKRGAFSGEQLAKLSPFVGDFVTGDQSYFMATYYMYFPFLTCEVKCGAAALDVADRQNAHSMTLAVRAVTELFRAVKREDEVHRQILAFSISHDHRSVRIYGHYPIINGKNTTYYRHPIHTFDFTALDGKEKWTSYQFITNMYSTWMPYHFKKICSAIDQLPTDWDFGDSSLPATGLSQRLDSHHLSQSGSDVASQPLERNSQSDLSQSEPVTPSTLFTDQGTTKKRRGRK
ncbi:hypothetical protein QQS21_003349 [Conoideocrella luteorostrata]|uniref:DUF7924 domain-containing protein n=1 Tax=Conoideocrella luteorostrata TaxID=1105319 RepID=A0AAJ0CTN5_9HYPO|nr:hypothetical protein QQS21_003349 [Conoideocrella luteorostrata]